jgi:hypothetical protein
VAHKAWAFQSMIFRSSDYARHLPRKRRTLACRASAMRLLRIGTAN